MTTELDTDRLNAAVEAIGRAAANSLELGWLDDAGPRPGEWHASATYKGARVIVEDQETAEDAVEALALKLLAGGTCVHCGRTTTAEMPNPLEPGTLIYAVAGHPKLDEELLEELDPDVIRSTLCVYHRDGAHWLRGCDHGYGPPAKPLNKYQRRRQAAAKALRR